ncbi:hypothetical protein DIPPA_14500 [Diplonema papillatum]|nr:hypothetical protein DIPPA_14500 [Diplonema papillatum]
MYAQKLVDLRHDVVAREKEIEALRTELGPVDYYSMRGHTPQVKTAYMYGPPMDASSQPYPPGRAHTPNDFFPPEPGSPPYQLNTPGSYPRKDHLANDAFSVDRPHARQMFDRASSIYSGHDHYSGGGSVLRTSFDPSWQATRESRAREVTEALARSKQRLQFVASTGPRRSVPLNFDDVVEAPDVFNEGTQVEALANGAWLPAVVLRVSDDGMYLDVEWLDGGVTNDQSAYEVRHIAAEDSSAPDFSTATESRRRSLQSRRYTQPSDICTSVSYSDFPSYPPEPPHTARRPSRSRRRSQAPNPNRETIPESFGLAATAAGWQSFVCPVPSLTDTICVLASNSVCRRSTA